MLTILMLIAFSILSHLALIAIDRHTLGTLAYRIYNRKRHHVNFLDIPRNRSFSIYLSNVIGKALT